MTRARAALVALAFAPSTAVAAPPSSSEKCISDHEQGQIDRNAGHLLAAKKAFLECSAEACPAMVRTDCVGFVAAVEADLPSIVAVAADAHGNDVRLATVSIDGGDPVPIDGRPVSLDPGPHRFDVNSEGRAPVSLSFVLHEGEQLRRLVAAFPAKDESATAGSRVNPLVWVFGGLGVAAAGTFAGFSIAGRVKQNQIEDSGCAPHCSRSDVDTMRSRYLVGDISLAVSLVSLGVGAYFLFSDPPWKKPADEHASGAPSLEWTATVVPSGATVGATGGF